jgi:hypothetical protein
MVAFLERGISGSTTNNERYDVRDRTCLGLFEHGNGEAKL